VTSKIKTMKITNLLNIFGILIILSSCSNNSNNKEKIQNKWWIRTVEYNEEAGTSIIKFTKNEALDLNKSTPLFQGIIEYSENKLTIDTRTDTILEMTDSSFVLYDGSYRKLFTKASGKDFILGKWTSPESEKIRMKFDDLKNDGEISFGNNDWTKISIETDDLLILNDKEFTYAFSEDKNNLTLKGNNTTYNLVRSFSGFLFYLEEDEEIFDGIEEEEATQEGLNLYSHAKTEWSDTDMGSRFLLDESSHIRYNSHLFKGDLSNAEGSGGFNISPSSQDNKYASINMGDDGLFICDLEKLTSFKLDIYSPYNWLSWGPNNNFVLFHHSYEADGTLFAYNLESNQLIELNFDSEFNIEAEQIIFDLESVWWVSNSSFEIPATINCNPYNSDTGCDGLNHDQVLKSNIYTYDIIANSFTKKAN